MKIINVFEIDRQVQKLVRHFLPSDRDHHIHDLNNKYNDP